MGVANQADQFLRIHTPLGENVLLITSLEGEEALSELFSFRVGLKAANGTNIPFQAIVNQQVVIEIVAPDAPTRHITGIVKSFAEAEQDDVCTYYEAEVVPPFWRLTRTVDNQIFQQKSAKEILAVVLQGLEVDWRLHGTYLPHNICIQYRESNFAFASRLMEEHGIHYYFVHSADSCRMVLADASRTSPSVAGGAVAFEPVRGAASPGRHIHRWRKTQEARSSKVVFQDAHFQLPGQTLAASAASLADVESGSVRHSLAVGNRDWELFEGRGEYAHMFDELTTGLDDLFQQKDATAAIRMQQETSEAIRIDGASACWNLTPGFQFALQRHFNGDGAYLITRVKHVARVADHRSSGADGRSSYQNQFDATPIDLPFRPQLKTPKPKMHGTLTATVVGPPGEVVYTDKYGRIKVQFHWDRYGKKDADSSCWLRPFTPNAGPGFGVLAIPQIGQEVLVVFHEGDPDEPHVIGAAHNPKNMPPANLPEERTRSYFKTQSFHGDNTEVSTLAFENAPGKELLHLHSQKDMMITSEHNHLHAVANAHQSVAGNIHLRRTGGMIHPAGAPNGSGGGGSSDSTAASAVPVRDPGSGWCGYGSFMGLVDYLDPAPLFHIGLDSVKVAGMLDEDVIGMCSTDVLGSMTTTAINPFVVPGLSFLGDGFKFGRLAAHCLASREAYFGSFSSMTTRQDTHFAGASQLDYCFKGEAGAAAAFKVWTNASAAARAAEMLASIFVNIYDLDSDAWVAAEVAAQGTVEVIDFVMHHELTTIAFTETIAAKTEEAAFIHAFAVLAEVDAPEIAAALFVCAVAPDTAAEILAKEKIGMGNVGPGATKQTVVQGVIGYTCSNFTVFTRPGPQEESNIVLSASGIPDVSGNVAILGSNSVALQSGRAIVSCRSALEMGDIALSVPPEGRITIGNSVICEPNGMTIVPEGISVKAVDFTAECKGLLTMIAVEAVAIRCGDSSIVLTPASIEIRSPIIIQNGETVRTAANNVSVDCDSHILFADLLEEEVNEKSQDFAVLNRLAVNISKSSASSEESSGDSNALIGLANFE